MKANQGGHSVWRSGWLDDAVLLAVAFAAGAGTGRLTSGPWRAGVLLPIGLCVVAGHATTTIIGRSPRARMVAPLAGAVAVVLTAVWTLLPGATRHGVPTVTTWRFVVSRFHEAGSIIQGQPTPLPPVASIVMVLAMAAGLAAVLGGALWGLRSRRDPFIALAPSFTLAAYTALFSTHVDRAQDALTYAGAALIFVAVSGRAPGRNALRRRGMVSGIGGSALAVGVALACSAGLAGMQLTAFPTPVGDGLTGAGPLGPHTQIPDLVDNIQALLSTQSKNVMFTATSTLPTYWQVGILSQFDGTAWTADAATRSAAYGSYRGYGSGDLPSLPEPDPTATFMSQITIASLQATLLPVPPSTIAVRDPDISLFLPNVGLVQPIAAPPGSVYTTEARVPAVSPAAAQSKGSVSASSGSSVNSSALDFYLALPPVPKKVVTLAHHVVAGISGSYNQAVALARYFDTGRFTYTLYPTVQPGESPLVSFLFTTHAGFCQQFAGAYAVLARLDGLPTRLAIGFTPGTSRNGTYTVTGSDSHVWPEVYLGPSTGWLSFEPTPAQAHESSAAGVVVGSRVKAPARSKSTGHAKNTSAKASANAVTIPTVTHSTANPSTPNSKSSKPGNINHPTSTGPSARRPPGFPTGAVVLVILAVIVAAAALDAANGGRGWRWLARRTARERRRLERVLRLMTARLRSRPGRFVPVHDVGPTAEVIARWERAVRILEASRMARRQDETLAEHAARIGNGESGGLMSWPPPDIGGAVPSSAGITDRVRAFDAYRGLADLATKASYGADPCTDEEAGRARELCDAVRRGLE